MIDIAIVILNWNTKNQLAVFLPSVVDNSLSGSVEIFVADNGSTDGSVEFLKKNFPRIKIIEFDANYGYTGGYNKALTLIDAKYYVLLNSDVLVTQSWLVPLKEYLDRNVTVAACMPKIKSYHNRELFEYAGAAGGFIDRYGFPFCRGRILDHVEWDEGQYDQPLQVFWATGACLFIRADLFHRFGQFDEDFFAHMEEIDLCWRIKNKGFQIFCIPQSVVFHVGGGTLPNENPYKLYLNYRNNLYLLYKNLPQEKIFSTFTVRFLMDCLSALVFLVQGKTGNFIAVVRAYRSFLSQLKKLREKRLQTGKQGSEFPTQVFPGSIIYQYFVNRRKKFSELNKLFNE